MGKRILFFVFPLLLSFAQQAPAFWDEAVSAFKGSPAAPGKKGRNPKQAGAKGAPGAWDKLMDGANKTLGSDKKEKSDWDKLSKKAKNSGI